MAGCVRRFITVRKNHPIWNPSSLIWKLPVSIKPTDTTMIMTHRRDRRSFLYFCFFICYLLSESANIILCLLNLKCDKKCIMFAGHLHIGIAFFLNYLHQLVSAVAFIFRRYLLPQVIDWAETKECSKGICFSFFICYRRFALIDLALYVI